jgi:hypothetical protein
MFYDKAAKAADLDAITLSESFNHRVEDGVNDDFRIPSREVWKSFIDLVY